MAMQDEYDQQFKERDFMRLAWPWLLFTERRTQNYDTDRLRGNIGAHRW